MTLEAFLFLLTIVSAFTALFVEGIKKQLDEVNMPYRSNILAGVTAAVLSILVSTAYIIFTEAVLNGKMWVCLIALVLLSWLSSMLGYDKIKQTILQIKGQ